MHIHAGHHPNEATRISLALSVAGGKKCLKVRRPTSEYPLSQLGPTAYAQFRLLDVGGVIWGIRNGVV